MQLTKKLKTIGSKGDTIIEILLAIAVLSLVLSVSYGLANRNSQTIRQAQERGEAQKLAEEQLELLRGTVSLDNPWGGNICFNDAGDPTSNNAECIDRGAGGLYDINISLSGTPTTGITYTAEITWDNIRGALDDDRLTLSYKLPVTEDIPITPHTECNDGLDNGPIQDGLIDENDPNCRTIPASPASYDPDLDSEDPPPQCSDGFDNDDDGLTDFGSDPGCTGPGDNDEFNLPPPQCNDGLDNDGDGLTDFGSDPGCTGPGDNIEYNVPLPQCSDSNDNDGDFRIDIQDPGCHWDGDRSNPYSYEPNFNNESRCDFGFKTLCF